VGGADSTKRSLRHPRLEGACNAFESAANRRGMTGRVDYSFRRFARRGSADLFFRSAALPIPHGQAGDLERRVRATSLPAWRGTNQSEKKIFGELQGLSWSVIRLRLIHHRDDNNLQYPNGRKWAVNGEYWPLIAEGTMRHHAGSATPLLNVRLAPGCRRCYASVCWPLLRRPSSSNATAPCWGEAPFHFRSSH
jgi:hypothetical protein